MTLYQAPDRLKQPLIRKDGSLQAASWEEALIMLHKITEDKRVKA